MAEQLNIYQRINEVRKKVHYIQKDKEVQKQYKAVTHDVVTAMIRNHLIEFGVIIVPRFIQGSSVDVGKTSKGATIIRYSAAYEFDFVNCDDPADKITVSMEAHANDQGDKAPGKAVSYATKYAILKLFSIETGEDEESRFEAYGVARIDEKRVSDLDAMIEEVAADRDAFATYLRKSLKVPEGKIENIPVTAYKDVVGALEVKRRQAK